MRVVVSRSGGIAGITRTWAVLVEQTPDPESLELLIEACPWDEPDPVDPQADRYVYQFQAGDRFAVLGEPAVQGPWRELVDRVRQFSTSHGMAGPDLKKHQP